jgi:hypothetical protein
MNNNKQLNKGDKMRKVVMIAGILSILASSASAGIWYHTPNSFGGGYKSTYQPTYNVWTGRFD